MSERKEMRLSPEEATRLQLLANDLNNLTHFKFIASPSSIDGPRAYFTGLEAGDHFRVARELNEAIAPVVERLREKLTLSIWRVIGGEEAE